MMSGRRAFRIDYDPRSALTHADLIHQIVQYARLTGWTVIVTPRGGIEGEPGVSDLVLLKAGRAVFVEAKVGRDKLSPAQIAFRDQVVRQGFEFIEARSVDSIAGLQTCAKSAR